MPGTEQPGIEQPGLGLDIRMEKTALGFLAYHGDKKVFIAAESYRGAIELNIPAKPLWHARVAMSPEEAENMADNLAREYFSGWNQTMYLEDE